LNTENEAFGRERVIKTSHGDDTTPTMLLKNIEEPLSQFIGTENQFDDITILAVRNAI